MRIEPNQPPRIQAASIRPAASGSAASSGGSASVQAEAVQLAELAHWLAQLALAPEERAELLTAVRQRLANEYYDSPSVIRSAAQELAQDLDWLSGLPLGQASSFHQQ